MSQPVIWWALASFAVLAEVLSGTVYLLMVAVGFAAGAITAHLGFSHTVQLVSVSVVAAAATFAWHRIRVMSPGLRASKDRDVELDVGETVQVVEWNPDCTARVQYRGTQWTAELESEAVNRKDIFPGPHRIVEVRGSNLILRPLTGKQHTPRPWA